MNKPGLQVKDKVATVYNSKGEVCETFSFRDHGNSYLSAAQNYLMQNYDKLMAEEVEQIDEGNKENKKKKNEYVSNIIKKKLSPEVLPSLKYGRQELKKEEVEQMDEAHKLGDPVEIVKGPGKGTKGYIGEIRHGLYKGAPKIYTVFHDEHGATQVGKEHIRKIKEEVEQMDEVSGSLAGRYAVAARKKEEEEHENGKKFVQQMRDAGLKGFGAPLYHKGAHFGRASRANMIKLAINKLTNHRVKVPATESVELEESEKGHSIVKELKVKGKHEEAGRMAFKHGLSRSYGPHFGMRSTKDKDERDFYRGWDGANMESKKKGAGVDRAFVAESNSDSAIEGYKNAIIHRLHNTKHPETGENLMLHLLKKHPFDEVRGAVGHSSEFHGEGAEEIGGSDVTAATHTALYHLGEKELVDKLRANARKPLEERSLTPAEEKKKEEIIMAMKEKGEPRYGAATAIAKRVAENKMLSNILTKLQEEDEGKKRGRPSKEEEQIGIHAQLKRHQDQGDLGSGMIKFDDGSSHKISSEHREKALKVLGSLTGPGKNPDRREQVVQEMGRSLDHFKKHIGVK